MLTLDQVRLLENRVEKAVGKITSLTDENTLLRNQLSGLQTRVSELEGLVRTFRDDQGRIEEGILSALDRLSAFEDSFFTSDAPISVDSTPPAQENVAQEEAIDQSYTESTAPSEDKAESVQTDLLSETDWDPPENLPTSESLHSSDGQMDIF